MLILVRHGRTDVNAGGRLLGRLDPELDDLGRAQVGAVATALAGVPVTRIVTSPLRRAATTAAAIAGAGGGALPVEVDDRWIELDYGELDGVPLAEVPPELWRAWQADPAFTPLGGESLVDLGRRVRGALADLAEQAVDEDVVVVSHVSPIKAAVAWALGTGDEVAWRLFLHPASITRVSVRRGQGQLVGFNDVGHLTGLG